MTTTLRSFKPEGLIQLSDNEFRLIAELVYKRFGINLTEKKKALVRGRLNQLTRSLGFESFEAYYNSVINDPTGESLLSLIDRISTNHSFFFREVEHFGVLIETALPEVLRNLTEQGSNDLRIWCAGCAGGEEPYTLAMVLCEHFGIDLHKWELGILATNISLSALHEAKMGVYSSDRIKLAPQDFKAKYFVKDPATGRYTVTNRLKRMILFKRLNLIREDFPFKGKFHTVFCRNVMIYFDKKTRIDLLRRIHKYMHEGAYLFIGHSETLGRETNLFRYIQPTVYRKC